MGEREMDAPRICPGDRQGSFRIDIRHLHRAAVEVLKRVLFAITIRISGRRLDRSSLTRRELGVGDTGTLPDGQRLRIT